MPGIWDEAEQSVWDEADKPSSGAVRRVVGDSAISLLKGAIGLPEAVVGLADIPTGGRVGKALETVGYKPKQAKEVLDTFYSPEQQEANRKVSEAKGFIPTVKAALENPSTITQTVLESAPSMLGGAGVARGVMKAAPKVAPLIAGAIGEGAITAGQTAEQARQSSKDGNLSAKQAVTAVGTGLLTGGIGVAGGKIAKRLGIADIDTMLASGQINQSQKNVLRRVTEGAFSEGLLEELPQSAQEQVAQNIANDKPWNEGVTEAAAMGMIAGGVMGGGGNVLTQKADADLLAKLDPEETSDIAKELLRVRNQPVPSVPQPETVAQPEAYEGPVMDAEAPTSEDLELQSMQRENENYRQQQLMDKQDIPTVEEKPVPQVPSSFKTADGKVSVKTKAVGEGVFQVETTNIDEYGHKKTFVQEMNAEDAVKHIDNVTPPVTRDQYLQVKGANDEAMSEVQTSNAEGNQSLPELQNAGSVNDSSETGGVVRPVGEGEKPGGAVPDTATSALPTGESRGMLPEGSTVETASSKESKASDETSKTAPKVVIKSLSDLPTGQHEIKGAGTFLVDDKGKVKILRGTKLESVDPMRRKLAIDKYNGMVLAEKQKANLEALKVGKTKQKAMAEEARGIAEDDAPFLRAALQNVKDADFGKISADGNQAEATWSTFGALIPYIRGTGFNKADAVKIMAEAVNTGKLPPEKNKAERSLVESALKHEKERIEEAENRVETEDERLVQQELAEERDTVEGVDTSFEFGEEPESSVLMEGDQSKLFPTPPTFGKKPQGTGTVSETPMLTEMKEREAESKQGAMFSDKGKTSGLVDAIIKKHLAPIIARLKDAYGVEVVQSESDLPQELQDQIKSENVEGKVEGSYDSLTNKIFLVADNLKDLTRAEEVLKHELVHKGIRSVFGNRLNAHLDQIAAERKLKGRIAAEEFIAEHGEKYAGQGAIKRFIAAARQLLRDMGFKVKFSDNDILAIAGKSMEATGGIHAGGVRFAMRGVANTETFKNWFGKSKVVDAQGKPLVVYHGTASDIVRFVQGLLGLNTDAKSAKQGFFFSDSQIVATGYAALAPNPEAAKATAVKNAAASGIFSEEMQNWLNDQAEKIMISDKALQNGQFFMTNEFMGGANVMPVYLKLENPLIYDFKGEEAREYTFSSLLEKAREDGHDGAIFRNTEDSIHRDFTEFSDIFVVFDPTQIKSATGNQGTFDPNNPDIRFSLKGKAQAITEVFDKKTMKAHAATALDKVHRMLENPGGLGSMERGKEYLQLKYLLSGTFDRLQEVQRNLYQDFRKASKETKEKIFEFMEDAQADPLTIPVEYRQKAINAKTMIMEVGAKLVARKMLPAEIYEENKGRYLPRVYLKHILGEDGRAMVMNGSGIKAYLGYLKKRLEMTPEQRLALGQIKDPGYLISRAFGVPMRDMEIFDFFDEMITKDEGEASWVLPESATPWTVDGGKAIQQVGNVTYTKNDDGTYNLTIKKVSHVQTKNKSIPASDLNLLLGSDKLADYIKAGKGKQVMRKDGDVYKPTPWKRVGHIQYRLNPDGTYNVNLTNKVASETKVDNVKNLEDHISEYKAERITEGKGKVINGRMVTPYWLSAEADRILTKQIQNMTEPDRSKAIDIAKRMQDTAAEMMEGLNKTPEEVAKHFQAMPDSPKYGALRGLWVRKEIYNDLVGNMKITVGERSWPEFLLDYMMNKGTSLWKWAKVAANPPTQFVNFISNGFLLHISGVPMAMVPYRMTQAISEMLVGSPNWQKLKTKIGPVAAARVEKFADGGKHWKIAKAGGVKSAGMANVELYRVEQDMLDLIALDKPWWHPKVMLKIGGKIMNATGDVYQMWESIGKTAKIIHEKETPRWREKDGSVKPYAFARDKGSSTYRKATDNEAIVAAHDALFDYSLAPGWVKFIRKFPLGTPFVTFTYKVLPATIKAAALTPWVFTPYLAIHYGLPYAIMAMTGIDDKDDYDKLMQTIFKFVREKKHVYLWPFKDAKGRWQAFDLGRYIPWAQWMAFSDHVVKGEIVTAFADDLGVGSGPAMDLVDLAKNQDSFTKQPIYDVNADFNEQAGQTMMYLTQMATPPWLTNRGWAGKLYSAMNNEIGKPGEQKPTVAQANLRLIGANFYPFDPAMSRAQNINQMDYAIAEVRQQKSSALKDRDLTDADRKELTLKYDTRIQKMNLKKMKYAANSMPKNESLLQR